MIFDFIKKCNFDEKSIIFEIGSHMGFDTEKIFNLTKNSKIYAFEPDPRNIKILLKRNINNIATLIPSCVSNVDDNNIIFHLSSGKIPNKTNNEYYDNNDWSASSSLRAPKNHTNIFPWCKFNKKIKVKSVTLDQFCLKNKIDHINFIWMDVQGCEDLVFKGGNDILKNTEYIYTEYSDQELYYDQKNLENLLTLLPGKWEIRNKDQGNVLLENISYRNQLISNEGYWNLKNLNEHIFDDQLADCILIFFKKNNINSCIDLGCGPGDYVNYLNNNKIETDGYDGNPYTPELSNNKCKILDLSKPHFFEKEYDCTLSLEVGEHIPEQYENYFIKNIVFSSKKFIIISWGTPGQQGYGHVNCKNNDYIIKKICSYGWKHLSDISQEFRNAAYNSWFKNTIMVFEKKEGKI